MAKTITLDVQERTTLGSKVKQLRNQGILPANVYGKDFESTAIQTDLSAFTDAFEEAGETSIINLKVSGTKKMIPVLVSDLDYNPVTGDLQHVDLRAVNLKEKLSASVPVHLVGVSIAVKEKGAVLVQNLDELEVEALPTDFPEEFEIDISVLEEVGDVISISDVKVSDKIEILHDPETVIAGAQEVKEEPDEPEEIETEIIGEEKEEGEAEEGADKAEKSEEKPAE